jgi:hypothetical protein
MVFTVCTHDPQVATQGCGAGAFAPSVAAVMPCGCVVSVTWWVLRDWVHTLWAPCFTGLLPLPGVISVSSSFILLSTLQAGTHSQGAGLGIAVGHGACFLG